MRPFCNKRRHSNFSANGHPRKEEVHEGITDANCDVENIFFSCFFRARAFIVAWRVVGGSNGASNPRLVGPRVQDKGMKFHSGISYETANSVLYYTYP